MVDQRIFERITAKFPVTLKDLNNEKTEAITCDVSAQGLGVICSKSLKTGSLLELWLGMLDNREPIYSRGTVMWTKKESTDSYRLGISLEKPEFMGFSRLFWL